MRASIVVKGKKVEELVAEEGDDLAAFKEACNDALTRTIERVEREEGVVQRDLEAADLEVERDEQELHEGSPGAKRKKKK